MGSAPAVAHEVDRLGGVAGEDDLLYGGGVDEGGHSAARRLVGGGRLFAQGVDAPMGIGVVPPVVIVHRIDHRRRFLRGGGAIEVNQRLAVDLPSQDREVSLDRLGVQRPSVDHAGWPSFIRSATVTDSSVETMVPCSCSQKAWAEQGTSA